MATIDHALAADTGLHNGSWTRNFFFSHEEEWLSGEQALTLSDFPEEYLTDLANEEEVPPSRNNFYRFQPKSNHKKGSKSTAGQAISDRIIEAFLSESPLPPLNLAFIGDKRVSTISYPG